MSPTPATLRCKGNMNLATIAAGGRIVVTVAGGNTLRLWRADTGEVAGGPVECSSKIRSLAINKDATTASPPAGAG